LRDRPRLLHEKHRAHDLSIALGDPAPLPTWVESLNERRDDFGHERLEPFVPRILLRVQHAMTVHDPSHVSRLMRPEEIRLPSRRWWGAQQLFDHAKGPEKLPLLGDGQFGDESAHLVVGALVERAEFLAPLFREVEVGDPPVRLR
jgi:hypothetical protein